MVAYKNVCIVGASGRTLGMKTTQSFLNHPFGFKVSLLTTPKSMEVEEKAKTFKDFEQQGAQLIVTETDQISYLAKALEGTDVVICLITGTDSSMLKSTQENLIKAATQAKVARFITSDFGIELSRVKKGEFWYYDAKKSIQELLENQSALEYTFVATGPFADFLLWQDVDFKNHKIKTYGSRDVKISYTHSDDVAKMLPDILLSPESKNSRIDICSFAVSPPEVVDAVERITQQKFEHIFESEDTIQSDFSKSEGLMQAPPFIKLVALRGDAYFDKPFNKTNPGLAKIPTVSLEDLIQRQLASKQ